MSTESFITEFFAWYEGLVTSVLQALELNTLLKGEVGTPPLALLMAVLLYFLGKQVQAYFQRGGRRKYTSEKVEIALEDRISTLTTALKDTAHHISEIQKEIDARAELVTRLKNDADIYQKLKEMDKDQVEAVAQVLQIPLIEERAEDARENSKAALFYTVVGIVLSGVVSLVLAIAFS